jgi:predicted aldo/keto reductase-like oxidoreductase
MTIEIDDAGTGDLVGDAFIGFLRIESGELIFRTLSVDLFKGENWENKKPLEKAVEMVKDGLKELNFQKEQEIVKICRGNIFDQVRAYFVEEGINYEDTVVEGKLQNAVEEKLVDHLRNQLGVRSKSLNKKSGAKRFFVLYNWLCHDFFRREKFVKSGFKKWNTVWRDRAIKKYEKIRNSKKIKERGNNSFKI